MLASRFNRELNRVRTINGTWSDRLQGAPKYGNVKNVPHSLHILTGREKEKGIKTKMRVKLAAKLLVVAWTLMKKREPFDPEYLQIG
jgi:hypothetical protein